MKGRQGRGRGRGAVEGNSTYWVQRAERQQRESRSESTGAPQEHWWGWVRPKSITHWQWSRARHVLSGEASDVRMHRHTRVGSRPEPPWPAVRLHWTDNYAPSHEPSHEPSHGRWMCSPSVQRDRIFAIGIPFIGKSLADRKGRGRAVTGQSGRVGASGAPDTRAVSGRVCLPMPAINDNFWR